MYYTVLVLLYTHNFNILDDVYIGILTNNVDTNHIYNTPTMVKNLKRKTYFYF